MERDHVLYNPYDHQEYMRQWDTRIKVAMLSARSGKGIFGCCETIEDMCKKMPIWSVRPDTMIPKWNIWAIAPTSRLGRQSFNDFLGYCPNELFAQEPKQHEMVAPLINGGRFCVRSADTPDWLVAEGVDRFWMTEAGLYKKGTYSMLMVRIASPDRLEHSSGVVEGTPQGQYDPDDPEKLSDFWSLVLEGQDPERASQIRSLYWFDEKIKFGNIEHPILSLTLEGRAIIDEMRRDPNMSEREFRQSMLGECLPSIMGRSVIRDFMSEIFVYDTIANPRYNFYRVWDFGRLYPVCTFHQLTPDNIWDWHGEFCPILQDVTDSEFVEQTLLYMRREFPDIPEDKIYDIGDSEATHKEDSRRKTTAEMMRDEFGIKLITPPKKKGDEQVAINTIQGRVKIRDDGKPMIRINPRAVKSIKCFQGMWIYEKKKTGGTEWFCDNVAEIHPWIDIFDTAKYLIVEVLQKNRHRAKPRAPMPVRRFNKVTGRLVS